MADKSKIEWCDATWNPITGCTPCSPGCDHCYAERMARRFQHLHGVVSGGANPDEPAVPFSQVRFHHDRIDQPFHWRRPRRIFVCSMGDMFHENVPYEWRSRILSVIACCQRHTFMVLTKRPQNVGNIFQRAIPPLLPDPNVWLGLTVCHQLEVDQKMELFLKIPAAKRFVSVEPILGPVYLAHYMPQVVTCRQGNMIDWVICGGETGPGARRANPDWIFSLRNQCQSAGVPFFFKSYGSHRVARSCVPPMMLNSKTGVYEEHREFPK